jgi:DNA-binding response OmpR family regulator
MNAGHPGRPLRVLMLEDSARDAATLESELWRSGLAFRTCRVDNREAFAAALNDFVPDVILLDCVLPGFNVLAALQLAQATAPAVPVIVVTGVIADSLVAQLLNAGAVDYLLKDRLARLGWAIHRALAPGGQHLPPARDTAVEGGQR